MTEPVPAEPPIDSLRGPIIELDANMLDAARETWRGRRTRLQQMRDRVDGDTSDDCWLWQGTVKPNGYGVVSVNRKSCHVHRVSYVLAYGPIPAGLMVHHNCVNRSCWNPRHLEAVTQQENLLRGDTLTAQNAAKTHCLRGHEYTPENTYRRRGGKHRACIACQREKDRLRRERNKSK